MAEPEYIVMSDSENTGEEKPASPNLEIAMGIDFGTSQCSVAVWNGNEVELLRNTSNQKIMLSYVTFKDEVPVSGVKDQLADAHEMVSGAAVFNIKRLIGRVDTDPIVQASKSLPFLVQTLNIGVRPFIAALNTNAWRSTTPEEVLAIFLLDLKCLAEDKLKRPIENVVMTIPVSFSRCQVSRIQRACAMAGLRVRRVIPEPTAVALLYSHQQQQQSADENLGSGIEKTALIFNMGAGFCDVAVTATAGGISHIKALAGSALGGEDFLLNTMRHILPGMDALFSSHGIDEVKKIGLYRVAIQDAIHELSCEPTVEIDVDLGDNKTICRTLGRNEFDTVNQQLYDDAESLVRQCLVNAKMDAQDINDIILVGGCSNIPTLREVIRNIFNREPYTGIDPLEAAARGAALEGALAAENSDPLGTLNLLTIQATPLSIGIQADGNTFIPIIHKNTTIPVRRDMIFTTAHNNQTEALVLVYEGDKQVARDNELLGFFKVTGIPPAPKGIPGINVSMDIDAANKLRVMAGVVVPGDQSPIAPYIEIRMPSVDDGHGWYAAAFIRTHGSSMDLATVKP